MEARSALIDAAEGAAANWMPPGALAAWLSQPEEPGSTGGAWQAATSHMVHLAAVACCGLMYLSQRPSYQS